MRSAVATFLMLAALAGPARAGSWPLTGSTGAHDPTIIKEGNMWWCFTTGMGVPVKFSSDGLNWSQGVRLFDSELPWWRTYAPTMGNVDVWAPDIQKFGDRYWCYYSVSEFGRNNSAIGLKSCSSILAGDWRDDGLVVSSSSGSQAYNAIDPNLTKDAAGNPWLAFGSWFDGIHLVQLDPGTMKPTGPIRSIARRNNGIEGANIVYANGYYYLFVSIDVCCQGVNSTYKISYGRSRDITGPYTDKSGAAMANGAGTILDSTAGRWIGPGGQDVSQNGSAWVIARHAYDALANGRPTLLINDLYWDSDSWPTYTSSGQPLIVSDSVTPTIDAGSSITFSIAATPSPPLTYQWFKNGAGIAGATGSTLGLNNVQPGDVGVYTATVAGADTQLSDPAVLGIATANKVLGSGEEVGPDIVHPNHNVYDQVLLKGETATITADPGQITRISYVDLNNDIVQLEFSGAGALSITLDGASGPSAPVNYNQPGIGYMKGSARIVVSGADQTTNLSVFSVGSITALNQALFKSDVTYDGWADIASVTILSANGRFGGLRTANASYSATRGITGIYAPGVEFTGPVFVGDINAADAATPMLFLGSATDTQINGGDLLQSNGQPVKVNGLVHLKFVDGITSHGTPAAARINQGRLQKNGVDVTDEIVVNP